MFLAPEQDQHPALLGQSTEMVLVFQAVDAGPPPTLPLQQDEELSCTRATTQLEKFFLPMCFVNDKQRLSNDTGVVTGWPSGHPLGWHWHTRQNLTRLCRVPCGVCWSAVQHQSLGLDGVRRAYGKHSRPGQVSGDHNQLRQRSGGRRSVRRLGPNP